MTAATWYMWQDWQGTSPKDARTNLVSLQAAKISGNPTSVMVAGVKVEYDPANSNIGEKIHELQKYLYEINENDWDWQRDIDPYANRPNITRPRFW